jgi:hypothetical protein
VLIERERIHPKRLARSGLRGYAGRSASLGWEVVMATIPWIRDVDAALVKAASEGKPVLLDFSAAPM